MILHLHQDVNCGQVVIKSHLYYSNRAPTHQDLETEHMHTHKNPPAASGERFQSRAAVFPAFTLLLCREQRSSNATQVTAMQKNQGSQETHQFNLLRQKGSSAKVNFFKNLMSLNTGVCI